MIGIPVDIHWHIRHCIEHAHTKLNNAPPHERVYSYLKDLFDDTDIDRDIHRLQTRDELDSDLSLNEGSNDKTPALPPTPKKKKKVTFFEKDKPSEKIIPASLPTPVDDCIDQLSRQLKELVLSYAESNHVQGLPPHNNFPNIIVNSQHCGMCGHVAAHQVGYCYCPETGQLIDDNLIKYDKGGRLVLSDGTKLPKLTNDVASMAQSICDKNNVTQSTLKGKGRADICNQPPHMTSVNFAGLQFNGEDILSKEKPAAKKNPELPPTLSDKRFLPSKPPNPPGLTKPAISPLAKGPETPKPPPINTREGQKQKSAKENTMDVDEEKHAKSDSSYHFVLTVQKMFDPDMMMDRMFKQTFMTTIGEVLGSSPVLQKRFNEMTQL
ncbi:hypothetical protein H0H87_002833 [Tephrocybe sp. NHM501043]|nr:hypothetical protein H0H87_002833 [Tephrocybe sp. NHM501043]